MIPNPFDDESFPDYISRCMRSGSIKKETPDKKKRLRQVKEVWYTKKNYEKLSEVVGEYGDKFNTLVKAHNNKMLSLEIESFPIGKLHPKKIDIFKKVYCLMRKDDLPVEDAYDLAIRKVNRLKMGMIT